MKKIAVQSNGLSIKHLSKEEQTLELQKLAVTANPFSIEFIEEPAFLVQLMALEGARGVYPYIKNPCHQVRVEARRLKII
jgi:hypothetical protein